MKKRILSIVLAICLVLSCVPITVFAANSDATALQALLDKGGTVKLTRDYTIDTTLNVRNTVTLDLNGCVIRINTSKKRIRVSGSNAHLTLTDSSPTTKHDGLPAGGVITGGHDASFGGGVYVSNEGKFTMDSGTIYNCSAKEGGGVLVYAGNFAMSGSKN